MTFFPWVLCVLVISTLWLIGGPILALLWFFVAGPGD
jgi:hypothetical protein